MKNHILRFLSGLAICGSYFQASAQGTAFTYQGHLNSGGSTAADGTYDFTFALYTAGTNGTLYGNPVTNLAVPVSNGLFTVVLDFGDAYAGSPYWLELGVRTNGSGSFTTLSPLQELTPIPYSVAAENLLGPVNVSQLPPGILLNGQSGVTLTNLTIGGSLELSQNALYVDGAPLLLSDFDLNFFAGEYAGNTNLQGIYNTGVGVDALRYVTTGSFNSAFGLGAMLYTTTGSNNTAAGMYALSTQGPGYLTGGYNTADGAYALDYNNSGSDNTAVGYGALFYNQAGSDNIALGVNAGINITGSSNIDIGHPGVAGDNMVIRIGSGQTSTYIAGQLIGDGSGLTNIAGGGGGGLQTVSGNDNFFAALGAGNSTASGADNVGVGYEALSSITSGNYNAAVGTGSLGANTNGSYNAAFGNDALAFNGSGSYNTALGVDSLGFSGFGSYNTAVGGNALVFNGGNNNTAAGYNALFENSGGDNNTSIGYYSMGGGGGATTGGGNSALGGYSLYSITSGYNNIAAGYSSMTSNTTGVDNIALGTASLQSITSGSSLNTTVGTYAFQFLTAGQENIGIGYAAGYSLLSGSNNIYIGNGGSSKENNIIRIGSGQSDTYFSGLEHCDGITNEGNIGASGQVQGSILYSTGNIIAGGAIIGDGVYSGGTVTCCSVTITGGCDLAEPFPITAPDNLATAGSVVVIDEQSPGKLKLSTRPYDRKVAGVLSGANGVNPGIQMRQEDLLGGGQNVALTGRVYVQADTSNGPIEPGDMLTTSAQAGKAMKVTDYSRAQGAILGKAMTGLSEGKGMVLVLVTLQ